MAELSVLQPCNEQKQAFGTEITLKYAKGDLAELKVNGNQTQDGTGIPSFENVRPIHGVSKITVNGVDYALPREIFTGDYYEAISATGQAVNIKREFTGAANESWSTGTASGRTYFASVIVKASGAESGQTIDFSCSHFTPGYSGNYCYIANYGNVVYFYPSDASITTIDLWKSFVSSEKSAGTPLAVRYKSATPQPITGTPQTIPVAIPTTITNDNGGQMSVTYPAIFERLAMTSHAFDDHTVHELMRMYTIQATVANTDSVRRYINKDVSFESYGQLYDITNFKKESGSNSNTASIAAQHVGYRLLNYKIQPGYAFVGTVAQIAADMLDVAVDDDGNKASSEFRIGTTPNLGTISFDMKNTDVVTAKYAIMALKNVGAESDFDNFTINFSEKIGGNQIQTFEFYVNMDNVTITYDKSNGTTYEIGIADMQIIDPANHPFDIGWYAHGIDFTTGEEFTKRVISYDICWDDPSKDKITLGVFVSDVSTGAAQMSIDVTNSIKQGQPYNSVDISRQFGFRSASSDGLMRVLSNGTQGFLIQHLVNSNWVTVWEAESSSGKTIAYNLDHTQKVEMGGDAGYRTFRWDTTFEQWWPTGGQGTDGSTGASKIFNPEDPVDYGIIGATPEGNVGLALYHNDKVFCRLLATGGGEAATGFVLDLSNGSDSFGASTDGSTFMKRGSGGTATQVVCKDGEIDFGIGDYWRGSVADDGVHANSVSGDLPIKGATGYGDFTLHIRNGVPVGWEPR